MVENLTVRRDIVVDRNPNPNPDYPKQSAGATSRTSRSRRSNEVPTRNKAPELRSTHMREAHDYMW